MFKSNSKLLLSLIAGVAVAGVAGTFWFGGVGNNTQTVANDSQAIAMNSIWDKETEPSYSGVKEVTVYRSPNCGCCGEWVKHMEKDGFKITDIKTDDMEAIKQKYNVPKNLASCHTSVLLASYGKQVHPSTKHIEIFILLRLGEVPGKDSILWTINNLNSNFSVMDVNSQKLVQNFMEGKQTIFPLRRITIG